MIFLTAVRGVAATVAGHGRRGTSGFDSFDE